MVGAPPGLLNLSDELLHDIVTLLRPVDLRRLSQVSHRLLHFVFDYSRPYVTGLAALPNELLLEVIAHLGDRDQSRLARTSHRFFPLVMDVILCQEVRTCRKKLLIFALKKRRIGLVRRLLQRGADVETRLDHFRGYIAHRSATPLSFATYHDDLGMVKLLLQFGADVHARSDYRLDGLNISPTPFHLAVYYGYGHLVKVLLQSGASQVVDGKLQLLSIAIFRHEHIVLRLLRALGSADELNESILEQLVQTASEGQFRSLSLDVIRQHEEIVLRHLQALESTNRLSEATVAKFMKCAVTGKLAMVTEHLAQSRAQLWMEQTDYLDSALYRIISIDACEGQIRKRKLHQEVYQIVETLLKHGADPDAPAEGISRVQAKTARDMASTHPDPRVRNRLMKTLRPNRPAKQLPLRVGPSWTIASQDSLQSVPEPSELDANSSASLWDFVDPCERQDQPEDHESDVTNAPEDYDNGANGDQVTSTTGPTLISAIDLSGKQAESHSNHPPPIHSYPRLASPRRGPTPAANRVWTDAPSKIRSTPIMRSQQKGSLHTPKSLATIRTERSQEDQFPVLVRPNQRHLANIKPSVWAAAPPRSKADMEKSEIEQMHTGNVDKESSKQQESAKAAKGRKKKWEKLVLS